ncbi:MAG: RNA-guided endonuclease IscB, partial [Chloroflexota bacterium]|nr:RNA-guided endonuclease IscB [Chloroflexota bacterium]
MSNVFVIDTNQQPVNPVHPGRVRLLLKQGKASVWRRYPFTIVLKEAVEAPSLAPLRIKLDPGSRTTGIAILNDASGEAVFVAELSHRGGQIKQRLDARRAVRRHRRQRKTRYRKPRFANRRRKQGWLPPSLESRIANVLTWVTRLRRVAPITAISLEVVTFDLQKMEQPEMSGVEYQQGTLFGYELREYVLEKWHRACAYCSAEHIPLQVEHIQARANGGTNRVSNLCLACEPCNAAKGTQDIRVFLAKKPDVLTRILAAARAPLKDASAVNASRWALYERLVGTGVPVEMGSGGLTKFNRTSRGLPKTHWVDAANVGKSTPEQLSLRGSIPLLIRANGHGHRQMCGVDKSGFPKRHRSRRKKHFGFQTGDMIRAVVTTGKKQGEYVGRVLVRASGSFDITTKQGRVGGISHRSCT